jgi:glycosyltransferase involved in cell wall biosynthesis
LKKTITGFSNIVIKETEQKKTVDLIYIGYTAIAFFTLRFLIAAANLLFSPVVKKQNPQGSPLVSVLIPARNEEENISNILNDLKAQSYRNTEVIVFNDQSEDRTRELVYNFLKTDKRFHLVDSPGLPPGWTGKNNACHRLALSASGDYFLFLDSDVRVESGIIESAITQIQRHNLKLLSIFPKQIMKTTGEKITIPLMNSILLSLLPLILTRASSKPSLAAANGQFMLFEQETYLKVRPHEKIKHHIVEDILIARMYKNKGLKIQCMTGNETIRCRMYHGYQHAIQGFSKNVADFFGGSHLVAFLYWLMGTFGILAVAVSLPAVYTIITAGIIVAAKIITSAISRQPVWQNLIFALPQQLLLGVIVLYSYRNKKRKKSQWKGRNIG